MTHFVLYQESSAYANNYCVWRVRLFDFTVGIIPTNRLFIEVYELQNCSSLFVLNHMNSSVILDIGVNYWIVDQQLWFTYHIQQLYITIYNNYIQLYTTIYNNNRHINNYELLNSWTTTMVWPLTIVIDMTKDKKYKEFLFSGWETELFQLQTSSSFSCGLQPVRRRVSNHCCQSFPRSLLPAALHLAFLCLYHVFYTALQGLPSITLCNP